MTPNNGGSGGEYVDQAGSFLSALVMNRSPLLVWCRRIRARVRAAVINDRNSKQLLRHWEAERIGVWHIYRHTIGRRFADGRERGQVVGLTVQMLQKVPF
jgi:hypothetical protein